MKNTCSIKFLKEAFIGQGIRMTGGSGTERFTNNPMKEVTIEKYNNQGFYLSHPSMPKKWWVDFDQLPLTRLNIIKGVIQDEITFVENIVNHRMQLIRTLDTEYIDLIYAEKELAAKKDHIISISEAIPGNIYIGAQCKDGTKMIFLGAWFTKKVDRNSSWEQESKFFLSKNSPRKAIFALESDELSPHEEKNLELTYRVHSSQRPKNFYTNMGSEKERLWELREKECEQAKKKRRKEIGPMPESS